MIWIGRFKSSPSWCSVYINIIIIIIHFNITKQTTDDTTWAEVIKMRKQSLLSQTEDALY